MPSAESCNRIVAASMNLHARAKHAHWNVVGPTFAGVHALFDKIAEEAEGYADSTAELIRFYGGEAQGTAMAASRSFLGPYTVGVAPAEAHLRAILASLRKFLSEIEFHIKTCLTEGEQTAADVFIEISRGVAKNIYLVQSHLGASTNG